MVCSKFTQVFKVTVGATEHVGVHAITSGVPQKYTERRSQSKRASLAQVLRRQMPLPSLVAWMPPLILNKRILLVQLLP